VKLLQVAVHIQGSHRDEISLNKFEACLFLDEYLLQKFTYVAEQTTEA
jgi:hypothetical protein